MMKRRSLECTALILALLLSLLSVSAFAAPQEEKAPLAMENITVNEFDSTYYNDGGTVINNFGTVYNNGGIVYNNGGTVYNNGGTVYNNGGIVHNNGAEVYNNGGTVHNNGGTVYEPCTHGDIAPAEGGTAAAEDAAAEEAPAAEEAAPAMAEDGAAAENAKEPEAGEDKPVLYHIELTADYSKLASIDGLLLQPDGTYALSPEGRAVIRANEGLELTDAITTAGRCTMGSNGEVILSNVDRSGRLTLKFKAAPPVSDLPSGSYGSEQRLSLSTPIEGARILYTTDGTSPLEKGREYKKPIELERSVTVKAVVDLGGAVKCDVLELNYLFPELEEPEFEDAREGYDSMGFRPIRLINTGAGTVKVKSVSLHGLGKDCFVLNTSRGGSVASGQIDSTSWSVRPADGLKVGEYEANLVFTLDTGDLLIEEVEFEVRK
ncbi:MAG: chitobiase/beta-hexosaminidase C-terminal domain-containing protein [Oscillospiraceae bacterium]|nr:chitobiase/beta-hexosaminidase C-terminal domain-containing protein [Oscillospiraceae bacterium]